MEPLRFSDDTCSNDPESLELGEYEDNMPKVLQEMRHR